MLQYNSIEATLNRPFATGAARRGDAVSALPVVTFAIHRDLAEVAGQWRAFEAVADCTAFQTYAWHAAWQEHVGDLTGVRPAIVVGSTAGRTAFIMPFAVELGRLAGSLVWHASELCDYNAPLLATDFAHYVEPGAFPNLFARILAAIAVEPGFATDAVSLIKMPETVGAQRNPFVELGTTINPSGAYLTRLTGTWDDFYKERRSAETRRRDRNKRKRLSDLGALRYATLADPAAADTALTTLFRQKSAAFARMGVPDIFARPGHAAFFRAIAADPANRDFVHVSRLDVGDTPAAINLALVFNGSYYHVLASYDPGPVSRFGPGVAHLHEMIAYAIGRGCTTFDFTIGDEPYKREWSDTTLVLHDWRAATTWRGAAVTFPAKAWARIKRTIKQTPFQWDLVVRTRGTVARLTGRSKRDRSPVDTGGPD